MLDESPPFTEAFPVRRAQLSLLELFFLVTTVAVAIGVWVHISQLLAFLGAAAFLVYAAIVLFDVGNLLIGGVVGFLIVSMVMWLFVATCTPALPTAILVVLYCPALGYLSGATLAVVRQFPTS